MKRFDGWDLTVMFLVGLIIGAILTIAMFAFGC